MPIAKEHNEEKLSELRKPFRVKIQKVLEKLESKGHQPKITCAYRSAEKQKEKFDKGFSKSAKPGNHNFGLAVDIIHRLYGWEFSDRNADFFKALRNACDEQGVASGTYWFGKRHKDGSKATYDNPTHKSVWNKYELGWDVVHCQYIGAPKEWKQEYKGQD